MSSPTMTSTVSAKGCNSATVTAGFVFKIVIAVIIIVVIVEKFSVISKRVCFMNNTEVYKDFHFRFVSFVNEYPDHMF